MKEQILQILNSEAFWLGVTAITGYLANSIISRGLIAKLPQNGITKRAIRSLHGFLNEVDPEGNARAANAKKSLSVLLALTILSGCAGTLEDSRGRISPAFTLPRSSATAAHCEALSDREFWLGLVSTGFGSSGVGAVVTAIPVDSKRTETALIITGTSAAAISVVAGWSATKTATTYVEEGCAK